MAIKEKKVTKLGVGACHKEGQRASRWDRSILLLSYFLELNVRYYGVSKSVVNAPMGLLEITKSRELELDALTVGEIFVVLGYFVEWTL